MTLSSPLALGDVQDVEVLCRGVMRSFLWSLGSAAYLTPHHEDEMLAHLLEHAWRLHRRFDPGRNTSFAGYARSLLDRRCVDWYRSEFGRGGGKQTPDGSWSLDDDARHVTAHDALQTSDDDGFEQFLCLLSPAMRRVVQAMLDGVSRADMARCLGISQKTAGARYEWALAELRTHFPEWPQWDDAIDEREAVAA